MNGEVSTGQVDLKTVHEHSKHFNPTQLDDIEKGNAYRCSCVHFMSSLCIYKESEVNLGSLHRCLTKLFL